MVDRRFSEIRRLVRDKPDPLVEEDIDGQRYRYKMEIRCRICTAPSFVRDIIDEMLINAQTYTRILDRVTEIYTEADLDKKRMPSYVSIRSHASKHLNYQAEAVREIVERRAQENGKRILEGKENILTAAGYLETIVNKSFDQLTHGQNVPVGEGIKASQVLHALEREAAGQETVGTLMAQMAVILQVIQQEAPPAVTMKIAERLEALRTGKEDDMLQLPEPLVEVESWEDYQEEQ